MVFRLNSFVARWCVALVCIIATPYALSAQLTLEQCRARYPDDAERLHCYDDAADSAATETTAHLLDAWQLTTESIPLNRPQPYRPIYFIVRHSNNINLTPASPAHTAPAALDYNRSEMKFQLSFKSELVSPATFNSIVGSDAWRLWFAYTQQSSWQILDSHDSRPFRNTNYGPELILTKRISKRAQPGWAPKLINVGLVHQSNGQSDPLSRSWNRTYLQGGWQVDKDTSLMLRVWHRWKEDPTKDDNPDISSFEGSWDAELRGDFGTVSYLLLVRHRYAQLDFSRGRLGFLGVPLHFQLTTGYGETLLDYNHRQTTFGVGWSFGGW